MEGKNTCNSCNTNVSNLTGTVRMLCPQCGKKEIIRCPHCRKIGAAYTCPECHFEGP